MTVRTRKTITDLIQQLKAQEKEIKSQLSDNQRRLNETRDRISTLYWVIEEIGDMDAAEEVWKEDLKEFETMTIAEWEDLVKSYPSLSYDELSEIVASQGFVPPGAYDTCPCSDCTEERSKEVKEKYHLPKAKRVSKKKSTKKGKK